MGNKQRGLVDVTLDGKTHQLRYTLNALAEVEERLKLENLSAVLNLVNELSMRSLRTLLWAGLLHAQPDLTEREVGEMDFDFAELVMAVNLGVSLAFKSDEEAPAEGNVDRPARGAGKKH